jgi:phage shock protein A
MDWWHRWGRMQRASDQLVTRAKSAQAQPQVMDAVKSIDILDPTSEVSRFEEKIRREEARSSSDGRRQRGPDVQDLGAAYWWVIRLRPLLISPLRAVRSSG